MGNNASKGGGSNPSSTTASPIAYHADANALTRRTSRRRESVQGLPTSKVTAAPPTASLQSAQGESIRHPSQSRPSNIQRSRTRSSDAATASNLKVQEDESLSQVSSAAASFRSAAVPIRSRSPVDIRAPSDALPIPYAASPHSASPSHYQLSHSHFGRPPRLPLPIEEEVFIPGSPIISPADLSTPLSPTQVAGDLPRGASVLSTTTAEDEEAGDDLHPNDVRLGPQIETLFEWKGDGHRVYVTGTFAGWNRKYRLQRNGPSPDPDVMSASIPLPPGTHHFKFIVDGNMRISDELPSAVDYTNVLVNWIDINTNPTSAPRDIPRPKQVKQIVTEKLLQQGTPPTATHSPGGTKLRSGGTPTHPAVVSASPKPSPRSRPPTAQFPRRVDNARYHSNIPRFLADLDAPEESSRFHRANQAMSAQPVPPTLPMFLNKSIMNSGTLPVKDDSSVLVIPNHTVLNHLATSSIKNNVLATSATTRYDQKYVTTIMYKPTSDTGE